MDRGSYRDYTLADKTTLGEVLFRYQREVLPTKKSQSQVTSMINQIVPHLGAYTLGNLTPMRLADYRDGRLLKLSAQSVKHELSLISRVLNHASREWGIYLPHGNPIQLVTKPRLPPGRSRRLQPGEEERLLLSLRHSELLGHIVTFALETALRRGEIASMKWEQVDIFRRMLTLPETKTDTPRTIPLSTKAADVLNRLQVRIDGSVWGIRADSITQGFDRACRRAGIQNLRFHDLRHEATSRLFEKGLNVMEVATITGHSDLRMLRRYTHLSESLIIHKLDNCCHMKTEHSRQVERSVTEDEEEIS
ncbi:MAG: site-specific integrase [Sedimenticola sp.]